MDNGQGPRHRMAWSEVRPHAFISKLVVQSHARDISRQLVGDDAIGSGRGRTKVAAGCSYEIRVTVFIHCAKVFRAKRPVSAQGKFDTRADHAAPDNTAAVGGDSSRRTKC